jgi:alpha-glucosidase (family GH31 glycosyl hydrolase)
MTDERHSTSLNLHSLTGYMQSKLTYNYLKNYMKKRPFLVSKSTFPGSGKYAGHWLGDDYSTWNDIRLSIPAIMNFHMFGIPLVGSNICGYYGSSTVELCIRWHQLGIFMPLSRNHNSKNSMAQEPYALGEDMKNSAKQSIEMKYKFILYHYYLISRCRLGLYKNENLAE